MHAAGLPKVSSKLASMVTIRYGLFSVVSTIGSMILSKTLIYLIFMMEYPIARMYADARVQSIYGGTNEIMKELIARSIDK